MEYLLKASAVVVIFYLCYKIFLQRDTFFEQNRSFLLLGIVTSFLLPFLVIPIYIEYTPVEILPNYNFSDIPLITQETEAPFNILDYLPIVYLLGVICFSVRFLIQVVSLSVVIYKNKKEKHGRYTHVKINKNLSPFSFFNWIVYNPKNFTEIELEQVITHEKMHVNQKHSIDILLTQLSCIVLWFNPFIWLYNNHVKQNLEFIADKETQRKFNCNKSYQTTLLKTSMPSHQMALTNNFYTSLIKKRIVMLHKSKSRRINLIKYTFVMPLLAAFLMSFNTEEVYVEKKNQDVLNLTNGDTIEITINKNTSDINLNDFKNRFKHEFNLDFSWKNLKRNSNGNITSIEVKLEEKDKGHVTSNAYDEKGIKPFIVYYKENGEMGTYQEKNETKTENPWKTTVGVNAEKSNAGVNITSIDGKNPIYIIDGKEITKKELQEINPIDIALVSVLKDEKTTAAYGDKGKNGVVLITTKKNSDSKWKVTGKRNTNVIFATKDTIYIKQKQYLIKQISDQFEKQPLYILDGKEINAKDINTLDEMKIERISHIKNSELAINKFGEKGKNGVVEITTRTKNSKTPIVKVVGPALFIVNGKKISSDEFNNLQPEDIKTFKVLKGSSRKHEKNTEESIIEITTKKK